LFPNKLCLFLLDYSVTVQDTQATVSKTFRKLIPVTPTPKIVRRSSRNLTSTPVALVSSTPSRSTRGTPATAAPSSPKASPSTALSPPRRPQTRAQKKKLTQSEKPRSATLQTSSVLQGKKLRRFSLSPKASKKARLDRLPNTHAESNFECQSKDQFSPDNSVIKRRSGSRKRRSARTRTQNVPSKKSKSTATSSTPTRYNLRKRVIAQSFKLDLHVAMRKRLERTTSSEQD
jgi:hypothetical protein